VMNGGKRMARAFGNRTLVAVAKHTVGVASLKRTSKIARIACVTWLRLFLPLTKKSRS